MLNLIVVVFHILSKTDFNLRKQASKAPYIAIVRVLFIVVFFFFFFLLLFFFLFFFFTFNNRLFHEKRCAGILTKMCE